MTISALDHINIRTSRIVETAAFYEAVLGMKVTPMRGRARIGDGAWVLDGDGRAILHIGTDRMRYPDDPSEGPPVLGAGGGAIHHVALRCDDAAILESRLHAAGAAFSISDFPARGIRQIFTRDPNGILIELNCSMPNGL